MTSPALITPPALSPDDDKALADLYLRGTPDNTLRAYERDLIYITAWKQVALGADLTWPESGPVALRFILDHARDLTEAAPDDPSREAAENLIDLGLRKSLACPAPSTLDRRVASWQAFHRMRNLESPFTSPLVKQARGKARRAAARPEEKKSAHPITKEVLERILVACGPTTRGLRDQAILITGWASGGRRRSEIVSLNIQDIDTEDYHSHNRLWIRLLETKTTRAGKTPKLVLKGRAAVTLKAWLETLEADKGPLFRPISKSGRILKRRLSPDGVYQILRTRLAQAGYDKGFATPHGLRAGFLTEAALAGAPIQAAMRLSLHRSVAQAQKYYDDVEITDNPATDLLD